MRGGDVGAVIRSRDTGMEVARQTIRDHWSETTCTTTPPRVAIRSNQHRTIRTMTMDNRYHRIFLTLICGVFFLPLHLSAQSRDLRAEQLVLDDDGADGTRNLVTIQTSASLSQDVIVTIPDPGADSAQFLLVPFGSAGSWLLGGNAGTSPGTDFLGTSDAQALHLYVNGGTDNGLVLQTNGSLQRTPEGDARGTDAVDLQILRDAATQVASGEQSVIGGGSRNTASAQYSTVGGGDSHIASGFASTIAGGGENTASGSQSFVGGGVLHVADGTNAAIVGGFQNRTGTDGAFVGAGAFNGGYGTNSAIVSGLNNIDSGDSGFIGGGEWNLVVGTLGTIAGGSANRAMNINAFVGGGDSNTVWGEYGVVVGGTGNRALGRKSIVGGGDENVADAHYALVAGGNENYAVDVGASVGGGEHNFNNGYNATIAGGHRNEAYGDDAAVGGGVANVAEGHITAIPGGAGLTLQGNSAFGYLGGNHGDNDMTIVDSNVAMFGNVDLWLVNNDTAASRLLFYEPESDAGIFPSGTNYTSFEAGVQGADINYILPLSTTAGTTVEEGLLQLDQATGQLSWVDPAEVGGNAWELGGNGGTTAGTDFLGTVDNTALHFKVNNSEMMIFNTNGSLQRDNGGDGRGTDAVDLQRSRLADTMVASGDYSVIGGGENNAAMEVYSVIGGGGDNTVPLGSGYAVIGGGEGNSTLNGWGTVAGGNENAALGSYAAIGGGASNSVTDLTSWGTIAGGRGNTASADQSTVGGGDGNTAGGTFAVVAGGLGNTASGSASAVGGGDENTASGAGATVGGGTQNEATASGATVAGGYGNKVEGEYSTIAGGRGLTLSSTADLSFGFLANDGSNDMTITVSNAAVFGNADIWLANNDNYASEIRFYEAHSGTGTFPGGSGTTNYTAFSASPQTTDIHYSLPASVPTFLPANDRVLTITAINGIGVTLSWVDNTTLASDRNRKEHFVRLSGEDILNRFDGIELGRWNYRGEGVRHYGIMAQDFYQAFGGDDGYGVVGSDTTVNVLDLHGVAFLAIQGLEKRTDRTDAEVEQLRTVVGDLRRSNGELQRELRRKSLEIEELRAGLEALRAEISGSRVEE